MSITDTTANGSIDFAKSKIHFLSKSGHPFHPNNFPYMDVIIFDIFKFYHRTEEIVKLRNHDPVLKHKQT